MAFKKFRGPGQIKQLAPKISGAPPYVGSPGASGPKWYPPVFRKKTIRTLQKVDPSLGITQPEGANLTDLPGVITGDRHGYKGGVRAIHQQPQVPPTPGKNTRVLAPPSPTNKGGVRSPFNVKSRVGRSRGTGKRFR